MSSLRSYISNWSFLIVILYILLGFFTFFAIAYITGMEQLFRDTFFFMEFNLVWFGLIILIYGLYALFQNYRRMNRLGVADRLDTQFLIIMVFFFLTFSVTLDFAVSNATSLDLSTGQIFAIEAWSKVTLYGAFVSGLFSIILPKIIGRNK